MIARRQPVPTKQERLAAKSDRLASMMEAQRAVADRVQRGVIRRADEPKAKPAKVMQKTPDRKKQSIRDSARGETCQVRLDRCCIGGTETTVWSHWPGLDAGRGMGIKSLDLAGAHCCGACHDVVDGRAPLPPGATRESVEIDWHRGHLRSLVILKQKGLV